MELILEVVTEEESLAVPEVLVPGLTTCGSSACSSTCCCCPRIG
jgi:hypothetical protein